MELYDIFQIVSNVLVLYIWYLLIRSFSNHEEKMNWKIVMVLGVEFVVSSLIEYLHFPAIWNLILTLIFIVSLELVMHFKGKELIVGFVFTFLILLCIDFLVGVSFGYVLNNLNEPSAFESVLGRLITIFLTYIVAICVRRFYSKNDTHMPIVYYLAVILFPAGSLVFAFLLLPFSAYGERKLVGIIIILLVLNIMVLFLYDQMRIMYQDRLEKISLQYLEKSYQTQVSVMEKSMLQVRSIKHDISRHLLTMNTLAKENDLNKIIRYLDIIEGDFKESDVFSNTGNLVIDSILNYEFQLSGIELERVSLGMEGELRNIEISEYSLTTVLSNLVRNAFQGVSKTKHGKVQIFLKAASEILFISVSNDYMI